MAYKLAYVIFLLYLRPATLRGNPSKMENPFKFWSIVEDEFFTDRFELEDPFFGEWLVAKH